MFQFHKNLRQILLIFLSTLIISNANANNYPDGYPECWKDSENPINTSVVPLDINKNNMGQTNDLFLPQNSKIGHKFFLVDFTSPLKKAQVDWIKQRIFGNAVVKTTPPYWRVSYLRIDDTPVQSQEIAYSHGRMKTGKNSKFVGEKVNSGCEGLKQIQTAFQAWSGINKSFENVFLKNYETEANRSLIFEYLFHILREPSMDFTREYPERELVIVSDLMQHSKRFSFYKHCKTDLSLKKPNKCRTFEKLLKKTKVKNYINDRKPSSESLKNLKVTILYINHEYETREGLSSSLVTLWEDLFAHLGIDNYEIVKQLAIN